MITIKISRKKTNGLFRGGGFSRTCEGNLSLQGRDLLPTIFEYGIMGTGERRKT
jgi:hypothetical protein